MIMNFIITYKKKKNGYRVIVKEDLNQNIIIYILN
nr:MAG TPA: hypothetical protein [Bacteriophage sp.]